MTEICTKLIENPIVDYVNQQFLYKPSQKYSSFINYVPQHFSDLDDSEELKLVLTLEKEGLKSRKQSDDNQRQQQPQQMFTYKTHQSRYTQLETDTQQQQQQQPQQSGSPQKRGQSPQKGPRINGQEVSFSMVSPQTIESVINSSKLLPMTVTAENSPAHPSRKEPTQRVATSIYAKSEKIKAASVSDALNLALTLIPEIELLHNDRKLLQANRKVLEIESLFEYCKEELDLKEADKKQIEQFKSKNAPLIDLVKEEANFLNQNLQVLKDDSGWISETEKGKIRISYQFADSNSMSLKLESELDVPLKNLICLLNEFAFHKDYVPFVKEGNHIKDIRKATKVGYALLDVPMLSKRECYFYGSGFNLLDELGMIPFISKSIHSDSAFCAQLGVTVPSCTKHVRLDHKYYIFNISPLGPNRSIVTIVLNVDYKVPLVPKSILNWCARKFALFLMEKITKKAANFKGSSWEKAIKADQQFYDWIDGKVQEFLQKTGLTNDSVPILQAREQIAAYLKSKQSELQKQL